MNESRSIAFYFDFISPYSWLALMQADPFAEQHGARWEPRPVVYGALLDATGLLGPAEVPAKRRYTFHDVVRCARRLGLEVEGPPQHPFRSLEALRTVCLFAEEERAMRLSIALADACWGRGLPLTDAGVLAEVVAEVGLEATGLAERIAAPSIKAALRQRTLEAIDRGVFGVPTFVYAGELFWGHDRLEHLAERLSGGPPASRELAERILSRPRGTDRRAVRRD